MQLGMIGLGRMGAAMAERLRAAGHEVTGFDADQQLSQAPSLEVLVAALSPPRIVWSMVPAGAATEATLDALRPLLSAGDTVIDGGNSRYTDSRRHAAEFGRSGLRFLDVGTSGGVWGLDNGYCLMVGGERGAFEAVEPLLAALATPDGYAHVGPAGAGHFLKMVHNGIEYGLMQAYAEGFELLHAADAAEGWGLDLPSVAKLWNHGSVVRSWLLELTAEALATDPELADVRPYVEDSGEGRWVVAEAIERGVPASAAGGALFARFASRAMSGAADNTAGGGAGGAAEGGSDAFGLRLLAALRGSFGGHEVRTP